MTDLRRTLADLAERGTSIGAERLRDRVMLDLAPGSSSTSWSRVDTRRPAFVILAAVAATLLLFGAVPLLFGWMGTSGSETASATTVAEPEPVPPVVGVGDGQTVSVTVSGVSGRAGDEMAGVLYAGGELTDLDSDALGGFWTVVEGDDFTTTEVVREPGVVGVGRFPFVSDQALTVEPGSYTLVLWVDEGLGPVSRWVPINTYTDGDVLIEGTDLFGCHVVFEVGDDAQTDVAVEAGLHHNGWNVDCATGVAIPGTDAAAAVAPDDMWMPELEMSMPPVVDATEWLDDVTDVEVAPDGLIIVAGPSGVASLDTAGEWTLVDLTDLPEGSGLDDGWPGRMIDMISIGPEDELWIAGSATSAVDDQEFGGTVDGWIDGRFLTWIALRECAATPCTWHVFTSDEIPELVGGIGDIAVSDEGTVYATVGENQLLVHNGTGWVSHVVPDLPTGWNGSVSPWSGSIAIQTDGVVWAGTNAPETGGRGLYSFDANEFTQHSADDGLPSNYTFQVAAAPDGSIWVATDVLYNDPSTAAPDAAAGVARYDGTEWTTYTIDDGLLSNDAFIATGPDGTVWAIHSEIPPYGYARFDGTAWTPYPTDRPVGGFRAAVDANGTLWTTANGDLISFNGTATTYASPFTRP